MFNLQYNISENNIFAILLNIALHNYILVLFVILVNEKQFHNFFQFIYIFYFIFLKNITKYYIIIIFYSFKEYCIFVFCSFH